jgi:hypothetical protein
MHSLQKVCPFGQHSVSMSGLRQRQQASKGLMESFPSRSRCVPYPSLRFSSYVKKARSLLFFECRCGIFAAGGCAGLSRNPRSVIPRGRGREGKGWKERWWWAGLRCLPPCLSWARSHPRVQHGLSRTTAMPSLGWPVDLAMGPYYTPRISGVVVAERNNDPCDRRDRCLSRLGLSPPRAAQSTEEAVGTLDEC